MTIENLRQEVSTVIDAEGTMAAVYFLLKSGDDLIIKFADIDAVSQTELGEQFIQQIRNVILDPEELSLLSISDADDRTNVIYNYDLDVLPIELTKLREVIHNDDYGTFTFGDDELSQLKGILVLIGNADHQMALYKHQYPVSLYKKDSAFSLKRFGDQQRFTKLEDDILRVNPDFEFFKINGQYYIQNIKTLERFFGFHDAINNLAVEGVEKIEGSDLIEDSAILRENLDNIAFSRKLTKAAKHSPVLGTVPNHEVIRFADTHPALKGKIEFNDDKTKISLSTKKSLQLFLKLLNDDLLHSELTKQYYDSLAKDTVANEEA